MICGLVDVAVGFGLGIGLFGDLIVGQLFVGWGDLAVDFVFELMFVYTTPLSAGRYRLDSKSDEECSNESYSLYVSEIPQSQSKKTAPGSALVLPDP